MKIRSAMHDRRLHASGQALSATRPARRLWRRRAVALPDSAWAPPCNPSGWQAWLVGLAILLTGVLRLAWLAAHAHRITHGRWHDLAEEISRGYGLRRPVTLLQSSHPSLLVTWGLAVRR